MGVFGEEGTKADVDWMAKDISAISKLCLEAVVKQVRYVNPRMLL
jgi:hypothetical protein